MITTSECPVKIDQAALEALNKLMQADGFDRSQYLRIGVKSAGCSGMGFMLGFDSREDDDDQFEFGGIPITMKKGHGMYLLNMTIGYESGPGGSGFTFNNPVEAKPQPL